MPGGNPLATCALPVGDFLLTYLLILTYLLGVVSWVDVSPKRGGGVPRIRYDFVTDVISSQRVDLETTEYSRLVTLKRFLADFHEN